MHIKLSIPRQVFLTTEEGEIVEGEAFLYVSAWKKTIG